MCRGQRRGWTTGHSAQRATGHRPCGPNQPRTLLKWAGNARHIRVSSCQFQALFNSLFKVLCIFPSRYLFAIGLSPIFSFRWNLPPTLSCTPKQLDSSNARRTHAGSRKYGILTLHDALFQVTCFWAAADDSIYRLQFGERKPIADLQYELFPLHSPLLGESWLVSFPRLSYMLKSRRSSYSNEVRNVVLGH